MRVGLTYDLREDYLKAGYSDEETAEFDRPETIAAIAAALGELGCEPVAIGSIHRLTERLVAGERWELVFNIAEGLCGFGREAQVPALLDAYDLPYTFSDPLTLCLTLHKGMAKRIIRDCGLATPAFAVVATEADIATVDLPWPLFVKPVAEGTSKGIGAASKVDSSAELAAACRAVLARQRQPALVETYLPGREFTVGVIGTGAQAGVLGILEVLLKEQAESDVYSYQSKEYYETRVDYRLINGPLAAKLGQLALACWRSLGCRDGGRVDLRLDAQGTPYFLEVNPLAGLHPVRSDLAILCRLAGISYRDLIGRIVESARQRCRPTAIPRRAAA